MKRIILITGAFICFAATSCKTGYGCSGNGKNVGAERVLTGDAKTMKALKRAGKFKS